ncbi:MAG: N-acetylneuraminate synthase family protein [bacterium]|nr:N-acetylneuraminate synthase family protein [bacterium]
MKFNQRIKIKNKAIGEDEPCFVIAEIGANHDQKVDQGKKLIDAAFKAGVDAVKFQSFTVENWLSKNMTYFPTMAKSKNLAKDLKKCELPVKMYKIFQDYADKKGLICFSAPSHITDVDNLKKMNVPMYKLGSVQITDLPTIKYAATKKKPIILSTGASNLKEIEDALKTIYETGNKNLALLHCTVQYPTPFEQVNLRAMITLKNIFNVPVGYSDHTLDPVAVPSAAVALGAKIIEKHITLNRKLPGPDHRFALEPDELSLMVKAIRNTEKILGTDKKTLLNEEKEIIKLGRRSIIARIDIPSGTIVSEKMLTLKRPGFGIAPKFISKVVGRRASKNIYQDDLINWSALK